MMLKKEMKKSCERSFPQSKLIQLFGTFHIIHPEFLVSAYFIVSFCQKSSLVILTTHPLSGMTREAISGPHSWKVLCAQ